MTEKNDIHYVTRTNESELISWMSLKIPNLSNNVALDITLTFHYLKHCRVLSKPMYLSTYTY